MTHDLAAAPAVVAVERQPAAMTNSLAGLGGLLRGRSGDALAWTALALLGVILFRYHLTGTAMFVGTSDRLNETFAIRKFSVDMIHQLGYVPAWNDTMFLGFAVDAGGYLPGINDPFAYLLALFPEQHLFTVYGYLAFAVFVLTAWASYLYIKDAYGRVFPAAIGSGLCALSNYSMLRIGQIDPVATTLVQMPLGLLALRRLQHGKTVYWAAGLTAILWTLLSWSFMQESVYVVMLFGCYALYMAIRHRSLKVPLIFGGSLLLATVLSVPRLLAFYEATQDLARSSALQWTCWCEIFRWFNDGIFGRSYKEAVDSGNQINLREGMQVYASAFSAFVIVLGFFYRGSFSRLSRSDVPFHLFMVVAVFLIVLDGTARYLVYLVFLRKDLLHSRFTVDTIVPIGLLSAAYVGQVIASSARPRTNRALMVTLMAAILVGVGVVWAINSLAESALTDLLGVSNLPLVVGYQYRLLPTELARILWSAAFLVLGTGVWLGCRRVRRRKRHAEQMTAAVTASASVSERVARATESVLAYGLGAVMVVQVYQLVDYQMNGPGTWTFPAPFVQHNWFMAPRQAFNSPSAPAIAAIRARLQSDDYRSLAITREGDPPFYGYPGSYVDEFWQLRLINGYPSMPAVFAALPWPKGTADERYLELPPGTPLPWELLALLNVRYAVTVNAALYYNLAGGDPTSGAEASLPDLEVIENPLPVAPRQFFTGSIRPVDNKTQLLPRDPTKESVVTGLRKRVNYPTDGQVTARYASDRVDIKVDPSANARFLVLNEMYHPRWRAFAGGHELEISLTNLVMRGLVVPPGVADIQLRFESPLGALAPSVFGQ